MPYDRDLPGEIMFLDAEDVAESLSWELSAASLRRLDALGPGSSRPAPASWVVQSRRLFLVTGSLDKFARAARCHGLTVIDRPGPELALEEKGVRGPAIARLLDRDPPPAASPRWWTGQEEEWVRWRRRERRGRGEAGAPSSRVPAATPAVRWRYPPSTLTDDQLAELDALIEEARAAGRSFGASELAERFGLGINMAGRLLRGRRRQPLTGEEIAGVIRRLASAGDGRVLAQDLVGCGVAKCRAAVAVRRYFGPDLSRLEPDERGRVPGQHVRDAYRVHDGTIYRWVRQGRLQAVGKDGRAQLFDYRQVRAALG